MFVAPYPTIDLKSLLSRSKKFSPEDQTIFTANGREALVLGLSILGIGDGDRVLIPAYICKVVPRLLKRLGVSYSYYPVKRDLTVDVNILRQLIESQDVRGILIVHYFGFADHAFKEILHLCKAKGVRVIEDCAHALYSRSDDGELGYAGDIGIFSIYKVLGTPTGGMLAINFEYEKRSLPENLSMLKRTTMQAKAFFYLAERSIGFSIRPYLLSIRPVKELVTSPPL